MNINEYTNLIKKIDIYTEEEEKNMFLKSKTDSSIKNEIVEII